MARQSQVLPAFTFLTLDTLALGAVIYLAFLTLWGLNYSREPLTLKLDYDEQRITPVARRKLLLLTIQRLNADSVLVHSRPWPGDQQIRQELYVSFESTIQDLDTRSGIVPAIPKTSLFDVYFGATGVTGFTNPFTHEVILNATLLPFEKPFIIAHEWGHLAGFAHESEANFIGLLTCARSDSPFIRYSGWLDLYSYLVRPGDEIPPLAPAVVADLQAIRDRDQRRRNEPVSRVERRAYDEFLKANRVKEGIGSYGLFVRLLLGTRFDPEWVPMRHSRPITHNLIQEFFGGNLT